MLFPLWPPVAIIALLVIFLILIILIYGDSICARVKTHTDRITVRARPSLEPMMRMGAVSEAHGHRYSPEQQQRYHQPPSQQQYQLQQREPQQFVQQQQHRYDSPPLEIPQPTTYGREIEV
ncbi:unnamed protein product [Orchesella dallaii]|uniref:Secreted protein n=1 Tax=Orchesella dallaii TaxID=48710 RepID=A0ABP1R5K9_9HEXA